MATAPTLPPPDGTAVPPGASQAYPETFDEDADAAFAAQRPFQLEMQALKANVHTNAQSSYDNALDAQASKTAAAASEANIAALSAFKGTWASLAGALAKPASAFHAGAFWALLNDLANVATSEPGVSADWQVVGGAWPIVPIAINTTAQPWKTYVMTAACTLTAPAITGNGKQFGVVVLPGVTGANFAPAGTDKTRGVTGTKAIDAPFSAVLTDSGATLGWI